MNIIESLKADIEQSKSLCWQEDGNRTVLNQITIMKALIVLLEKAAECKVCGNVGTVEEVVKDDRWRGGTLITKTVLCKACNGA